ncbi:MAG: hypothetical protein CMG60_02895 [Candidatus Marinimicrobia bacterium]|nr:hypothetical protein [Candidatus Neomarinimicrobiota bacterium]
MKIQKLFKITEEDKIHYKELIQVIDVKQKDSIVFILRTKIQNLLDEGKLNSVEAELIKDIGKLAKILEIYQDLPDLIIKKILFAMSYFIDENDEIPDVIPNYGYLDDITVVSWILNDIEDKLPQIPNA